VLPLFDNLPDGFSYVDDFLTETEEARLLAVLAELAFATFEMRGVVARRRVAFYGATYDRPGAGAATGTPPIPDFLLPLRERVGRWGAIAPDAFVMALINEYRAGAPIGWHRDAPQYGVVAGISLGSPCRMRFRPYRRSRESDIFPARQPRNATHELLLRPRSAYLMTGSARAQFEHSIPPVNALRYSITFRTLRGRPPAAG
jgi:alkylated DNA repair dioxygenase AlkB